MRARRGGAPLFVLLALAALAGAAGVVSVSIHSSENRQTWRLLADPDATDTELAEIAPEDLDRLRSDLPTNAEILTGFAALGTATLPGGETAGEVAGRALTEQVANFTVPAVVDAMSDPASSFNQERPEGGTRPTGGVVGGPGEICYFKTVTFVNHTGLPIRMDQAWPPEPLYSVHGVDWGPERLHYSHAYSEFPLPDRVTTFWIQSRERFSDSDPDRKLSEGAEQLCWGPWTYTVTCEGLEITLDFDNVTATNDTHAVCPEGFVAYRSY